MGERTSANATRYVTAVITFSTLSGNSQNIGKLHIEQPYIAVFLKDSVLKISLLLRFNCFYVCIEANFWYLAFLYFLQLERLVQNVHADKSH